MVKIIANFNAVQTSINFTDFDRPLNKTGILESELMGNMLLKQRSSYDKIISSLDSTLLGKEGKILDETKNMLLLNVNNSVISVPKNNISLKINLDNTDYIVHGSKLLQSPSNRNTKLELNSL